MITDNHALVDLFARVQSGELSPEEALQKLRWQPLEAIVDPNGEIAQLDHHRLMRQGLPEFVFAEGKSPEQTAGIMAAMVEKHGVALASRAGEAHFQAVKLQLPQAVYDPMSRLITVGALPTLQAGCPLVVAAGTSDLPVAREASGVLRFLGHTPEMLIDVGIAGIHRLLANSHLLNAADVLIVVAGMDGALPTAVSGLVSAPVIAVPTSVGYGASFGGLAALLTMLTSCSPGLTVVNIDNGLGAAAAAHRILMRSTKSS